MIPFNEKHYHVFEIAEMQGVDVSVIYDWFGEGLKHAPRLADGCIEVRASDLREFLDSRRKADVLPTTESDKAEPAKPRWHAHGRLTPGEVAEWQGVSLETVEQWIGEGLPCEDFRGTRLIWRGDAKKFLATHGTQAPDATDGTTRSESATGHSVIVAEEFDYGFFG